MARRRSFKRSRPMGTYRWVGDYRSLTIPSSTALVLADMSQLLGAVAFSANSPGLNAKVRIDRIIMQTSTRRAIVGNIESCAWGVYNIAVDVALAPIQLFDPTSTDPDRSVASQTWRVEMVDIPGIILNSADASLLPQKVECATTDWKPRKWLDRSKESLQLSFAVNDLDNGVHIDFRFRLLIWIP